MHTDRIRSRGRRATRFVPGGLIVAWLLLPACGSDTPTGIVPGQALGKFCHQLTRGGKAIESDAGVRYSRRHAHHDSHRNLCRWSASRASRSPLGGCRCG